MQGSAAEAAKRRFTEPAKFLPVAFVCANIAGLWIIYTFLHLLLLWRDRAQHHAVIVQCVSINVVTALVCICYARCIMVHPGTIPDKDEDANWDYMPRDRGGVFINDIANNSVPVCLQEQKRSGDRRHCKWCQKYKPDRCHHCRVCRLCILKMDHHCPWIYNCVGFKNHKYFFLLLLYAAVATHIIMWTMVDSVKNSVGSNTPFLTLFLLLFGETLATFLAFLLSGFFLFHCWLMQQAMSTIEHCEKSLKKENCGQSKYDKGFLGNIKAVLGDNPCFWLLPFSPPSGSGLTFVSEEMRFNRDMEQGRVQRQVDNRKAVHRGKLPGNYDSTKSQAAGASSRLAPDTGSAPVLESRNSSDTETDAPMLFRGAPGQETETRAGETTMF